MMYNRYIPQDDGSFRRNQQQDHVAPPAAPPCSQPVSTCSAGQFFKNILPGNLDTGDLLVIVLLLLIASDSGPSQNQAMLTLALYLFL